MIPFPYDPLTDDLDLYVVGGAVRDYLMDEHVSDFDWVVVGATPEHMLALGFMPVGADFPVFLHPHTRQEYALARTERKTAKGYHGFTFHADEHVTLEQDLARRDLTINAMAMGRDGRLVDPYHGQRDILAKQFRHVSPAFSEDPVRILRLARFSARFPAFNVCPETMELCQHMVQQGEVDALVPERVWAELSRGLMSLEPDRMIECLLGMGALERLLPVLQTVTKPCEQAAWWIDFSYLKNVAGLTLPQRYAVLLHSFRTSDKRVLWLDQAFISSLNKHLKVPNECADMPQLLRRFYTLIQDGDLSMHTWVLKVLECLDVFRKSERFFLLLDVFRRLLPDYKDMSSPEWWRIRFDALHAIDAKSIAQRFEGDGAKIKEAIYQARLCVLEQFV